MRLITLALGLLVAPLAAGARMVVVTRRPFCAAPRTTRSPMWGWSGGPGAVAGWGVPGAPRRPLPGWAAGVPASRARGATPAPWRGCHTKTISSAS